MIVITGASGQLGRLVIQSLLQKVPASQIAAVVRNPAKAADLAALGITLREADYNKPETLAAAFTGASKLLLISSSELGQRVPQHKAVIEAAKKAGVGLLAYTSLLHANTSPLGLAADHQETERLIQASGIPAVILRNGWYTENYLASVPPALQYGVMLGSAGAGRIASAARADYAEAAAVVLSSEGHAGKVYELAGDTAYTLPEFVQEIATQSGKAIAYKDLPQADFKAALLGAGLPEPVADLLADSDVGASKGGLFNESHTLSRLIGRATTPLAASVAALLQAKAAA